MRGSGALKQPGTLRLRQPSQHLACMRGTAPRAHSIFDKIQTAQSTSTSTNGCPGLSPGRTFQRAGSLVIGYSPGSQLQSNRAGVDLGTLRGQQARQGEGHTAQAATAKPVEALVHHRSPPPHLDNLLDCQVLPGLKRGVLERVRDPHSRRGWSRGST